jgi:isopentenyldiphosphate isomerase
MKQRSSAITLIYDERGDLALQLRAAHDDSYPSHWDFSAGGMIDESEDPHAAAIRELQEELGVACEIEYVGKEVCMDEESIDQLYMYRTTYSGPFKLNNNEVADLVFFSPQKIQEMIYANEKFHPELRTLWQQGLIPLH